MLARHYCLRAESAPAPGDIGAHSPTIECYQVGDSICGSLNSRMAPQGLLPVRLTGAPRPLRWLDISARVDFMDGGALDARKSEEPRH